MKTKPLVWIPDVCDDLSGCWIDAACSIGELTIERSLYCKGYALYYWPFCLPSADTMLVKDGIESIDKAKVAAQKFLKSIKARL